MPRRSFLRRSGAASVATVLAVNGLTVEVKAVTSAGTWYEDAQVTMNEAYSGAVGNKDIPEIKTWAAGPGGVLTSDGHGARGDFSQTNSHDKVPGKTYKTVTSSGVSFSSDVVEIGTGTGVYSIPKGAVVTWTKVMKEE